MALNNKPIPVALGTKVILADAEMMLIAVNEHHHPDAALLSVPVSVLDEETSHESTDGTMLTN